MTPEQADRVLEQPFSVGGRRERLDDFTISHCRRVRDTAVELALVAGFRETNLKKIAVGATLHDLGKIGMRRIVEYPDKLTHEMARTMGTHPAKGEDLAFGTLHIRDWDVLRYIRNHHEKWNGEGYPDRLRGSKGQIGFDLSIMSYTDVIVSLLEDRSYRAGWTPREMKYYILNHTGKNGWFDPRVREIFCEWYDTSFGQVESYQPQLSNAS